MFPKSIKSLAHWNAVVRPPFLGPVTDQTLEVRLHTISPSRNVSEIIKEDCFAKYQ